jgi:hypothetical protein
LVFTLKKLTRANAKKEGKGTKGAVARAVKETFVKKETRKVKASWLSIAFLGHDGNGAY